MTSHCDQHLGPISEKTPHKTQTFLFSLLDKPGEALRVSGELFCLFLKEDQTAAKRPLHVLCDLILCGWICPLLCYSVGRKSTLLLKFFSTIFIMPSLRWTGPVDKISVLLTIKIVVHLMTWSLTPAQTTGKCWSVLQMTPALSTLLAGSQ